MRIIKMFYLTILVIFIALENGYTQQPAMSESFTTKENVAIEGYDVVTYFTQHMAVRGSQKISARFHEVDYWFSNSENKSKFQENPEKFLPQYGGYCSIAVASNAKAPSDPKTFKLRDGKLYLFYNDYFKGEPLNTIIMWNMDEQNMVSKANMNWKMMKHKS